MTNTDNYGVWLSALLTPTAQAGVTQITMTDTGGVARTFDIYGVTIGLLFNDTVPAAISFFLQLGTGTTAATRADTVLQTPIVGTAAITSSYITGSGVATLTGSITYALTKQPTECGLFATLNDTGGASRTVMFDHQVFSARPAALTFTLTWTITLG